jgi:hypothetical protein
LALGAGIEVVGAFKRADNARGNAVSGGVTADLAYAMPWARGFELRAGVGAAPLGPQSLRLDAGARVMLPIGTNVLLGPEVMIGPLFPLGGDRVVRLWFKGAIPIAIPINETAQIEAYPELAYAFGGTSALGFVGGGVRGVLRF